MTITTLAGWHRLEQVLGDTPALADLAALTRTWAKTDEHGNVLQLGTPGEVLADLLPGPFEAYCEAQQLFFESIEVATEDAEFTDFRREALRAVLARGMHLEWAARWFGTTLAEIVSLFMHSSPSKATAMQVLAAEQMLREDPCISVPAVARRVGVSGGLVRRLSEWCNLPRSEGTGYRHTDVVRERAWALHEEGLPFSKVAEVLGGEVGREFTKSQVVTMWRLVDARRKAAA